MDHSGNVQVLVPDIGDFDSVDVIEILVKTGDEVRAEAPLITLESDKATMDIPAPQAGRITAIHVRVGDKVAEGSLIVEIAPVAAAATDVVPAAATPTAAAPVPTVPVAIAAAPAPAATVATSQPVLVPDIGDFEAVEVIEVLVKAGDSVAAEASLITLESDKATMDIPAPFGGTVTAVKVKVGDKVAAGSLIAEILTETAAMTPPAAPSTAAVEIAPPAAASRVAAESAPPAQSAAVTMSVKAYASPAMRKFARELGVDLDTVKGSGRKGRIVKEDITTHVKQTLRTRGATTASSGFALPEAPVIDFSKYGAIEAKPLSKIKRATGQNLHRSWVTIPHVTQFDEADITELEAFRQAQQDAAQSQGVKLTLLAFLIKAVTSALAKFPDFNSSLAPDGESLIYKKYFHIGVAVNSERGLLVPVVRDADQKRLHALAREVRSLSQKARDSKLTPAEMQGSCFTITSLGGISGTGFTPIINPPEVAILGISPAKMKPAYSDGAFIPRLMLPYSLSYDHRVIDGVAAAEFTRYLSVVLSDIRTLLL